jgi:hypothetical protein
MDKLDQLIADKEREVSERSKGLEVAQIELRTLKLAASVRPAVADVATTVNGATSPSQALILDPVPAIPERRIGRKAGDLSEPYRRLMGAMAARGDRAFEPQEIAALAKGVGISITPKRARERMDKYVGTGLAEKVGTSFRITDFAVSRLGLKRAGPPAGSPQTAH